MKKRHVANSCFAFYMLFLSGCANHYQAYFKPYESLPSEVVARNRTSMPPETPIVYRTDLDDVENSLMALGRRGIFAIGESSFYANSANDQDALEVARYEKADVLLLVNPRLRSSSTSVVPFTVPTTHTTYSTGSATAYGSGGVVNAYGTGTSTTYGSNTTYVPVTNNSYDYAAIYLVKMKSPIGLRYRNLNSAEKKLLASNQGVAIVLVVESSPAFLADILEGDLVVAVNGSRVVNQEDFSKKLKSVENLTLSIVRGDKTVEKVFQAKN